MRWPETSLCTSIALIFTILASWTAGTAPVAAQESAPPQAPPATAVATGTAGSTDATGGEASPATDATGGEASPATEAPAQDAAPVAPDVSALVTAMARYNSDAATDRLYLVGLDTGSIDAVDRVLRDARTVRVARLDQNLFGEIGRPTDPPAHDGEILLEPLHLNDDSVRDAVFVETSTGYLAYFERVGRGGQIGNIKTTVGRPFTELATGDGNYALLMRRSGNGRTTAATLYHATSGRALQLRDLDDLPTLPVTREITGLPAMQGRVSAAAIQIGGGRTIGWVLADGQTGELFSIGLDESGRPLGTRPRPENLFDVFDRDAVIDLPQRFQLLPVQVDGQSTRHLLLIDLGNGELAWIRNIDARLASPTLEPQRSSLQRMLSASGTGPRGVAMVPRVNADGATVGVWLFDGASRALIYIENLQSPGQVNVGSVLIER